MVLTKVCYIIFKHFSTCHKQSHTFFILFFKFCDKEIYNLFGSVLLFKQFAIQIRLNFLCLDDLQLRETTGWY